MGFQSALVVDDSRSARYILRSLLERERIRVDTVESAQAALDFLRERRPDIVFMDDLMPGMDGLEAIDRMASDPSTARIPVIMYTGRQDTVSLEQARLRGVVGILSKPFTPEDVRKVLVKIGHGVADDGAIEYPEKPMVARLVRSVDAEQPATAETAQMDSVEQAPDTLSSASAEAVLNATEVGFGKEQSVATDRTEDLAALRAELLQVVKSETRLAVDQMVGEFREQNSARLLELQSEVNSLATTSKSVSVPDWLESDVESLRTQLMSTVKSEAQFAVEQLIGEMLENQVAAQMQVRESVWRRILDGLRLENERFQIQILEQRIPRLLELMEQRLENRVEVVRKTVTDRLEDGNLSPLQRTMVAHVARTAAAEAVQRPARQSARRVAADFIRTDLNAVNQRFDRLRQRFNLVIGLGLFVMLAVAGIAYLIGTRL